MKNSHIHSLRIDLENVYLVVKFVSLIYCSSLPGFVGIRQIVLKPRGEKGNLDFSYWSIVSYKDE